VSEKPDPSAKSAIVLNELTAISPLDGRYWERVSELSPYASEMGLIKTRVEIEARYLVALSDVGLVRHLTAEEKKRLVSMGESMTEEQVARVKEIETTTRHDVKAMERAFREMVAGTSLEDVTEMIHFGLTSEDVNNLSYRLMLDRARKNILVPTLDKVVDAFVGLADQNKAMPMLARTHGQPALPTTLGKEMVNFAARLNKEVRKLAAAKLTGKLNGAVGDYNALELAAPQVDWIEFSKKFVASLGLEPNLITTQINPYEDEIEMFHLFQLINGIVLDIDQDIWRYISDDWFTQEVKKGEVGSSTMPQKVNPIDFENSEGNVAVANSLFEGMGRKLPVSRLQRDLSDSTTIRNIGVALGHSLLAYKSLLTGLGRIHPNEAAIAASLNDNWTILTEGVQTVLRRAALKDPYSIVASLSRGQHIGLDEWSEWIDKLDITPQTKTQLRSLRPEIYIGKAVELTELAIQEIKASRNS
jgi:adenylosuccinate lyase